MNKQKEIKEAIKMVWLIAVIYLSLIAFMYVFQRHFVFAPSSRNPFAAGHAPFQVLNYQTPAGLNLRGLYVPAKENRPTIVYFHGNAGNLADRIYKAQHFLDKGYGVALVGYRGYSGNPGQPTEQGLYEDGRAVIRQLEQSGVKEQDIVLYGESLGTGVATQMATEIKAKALILEAPFTSTIDVGARVYWFLPVRFLLKDKFENLKKIGDLTMPIMIIHGTDDRTIPYAFGEKLFANVHSQIKEFVTLKGAGHADIYDFDAGNIINAFLAKL